MKYLVTLEYPDAYVGKLLLVWQDYITQKAIDCNLRGIHRIKSYDFISAILKPILN